jgi:hypothetical protein
VGFEFLIITTGFVVAPFVVASPCGRTVPTMRRWPVQTRAFSFPRQIPSGFFDLVCPLECRGRRECRVHQSHPRLACIRKRHRYTETPAFPAQWFTAYSALSPVHRLVGHRRRSSSTDLIPASGDQDHTPSPSASARFVSRVNASTATRLAFRDDWPKRPSCSRRDGDTKSYFSEKRKKNILAGRA